MSRISRMIQSVVFLSIITITLSSVLLFWIQPLFAKMILPGLGGSPAVWTTSLVFFQIVLLAGYLYAHLSSRCLTRAVQVVFHIVILPLALHFLPIRPEPVFSTDDPFLKTIGLLAGSLGIPFFILTSTASLVQKWFSEHNGTADPYFLYAFSNLGSLGILLAYPVLVEPLWTLARQSEIWSSGYLFFAVSMGVTGLWSLRGGTPLSRAHPTPTFPARSNIASQWIILAAIPSSLLVSVTTHITTDLAPVPFLWIAPLALYLLTFILAFARRRPASLSAAGRVLPPFLLALAFLAAVDLLKSSSLILPVIHLAVFVVLAALCHIRLADLRPDPQGLTKFYLLVSAGGALGGFFSSIAAPMIFDAVWEYPIVLAAAPLALLAKSDRSWPIAAFGSAALAAGLTWFFRSQVAEIGTSPVQSYAAVLVVMAVFATGLWSSRSRFAFSALIAVLFLLKPFAEWKEKSVVWRERTFHGVHSITRSGRWTTLSHGTTMHGAQYAGSNVPFSYYHPDGPVGDLFDRETRSDSSLRVAAVGLGTGAIAGYGEHGQTFTFFEIDPVVVRVARDTNFFTFLDGSRAHLEFVLGDARVSLVEFPDSHFDLIVLDAFSSDAIPIHLLTREAFALYGRKLAPDGRIAVHISNRFLDLYPLLRELAADGGWDGAARLDSMTSGDLRRQKSHWIVLSRTTEALDPLPAKPEWGVFEERYPVRVWTDDYSNIFRFLKE